MNFTQIKYAKERAKSIKDTRARKICDKYAKQKKRLTDDEKIKALKNGRFSIVAPKDGHHYWYDAIKFDGEVREDVVGRSAELAKLDTEYQKLIDELVLGDCDKALEMLKKFEGAI